MDTQILDWNDYFDTSRKVAGEGCILLENKNNVLPLKAGTRLAVFGRMQDHYYNSGTGSGGMVNVDKVWSIVEGLQEDGSVTIDSQLREEYASWEKEHPVVKGMGWGAEPWSQEEMPVTEECASKAAARNDAALIIIARTAGEDHDNSEDAGSWNLTETETALLKTVRAHFGKVIVVLNTGNIIDMSAISRSEPDAVLLAWQGGQAGGRGTADVLTGRETPSGKLTDTIAGSISDYPAYANFGDNDIALYQEDIYVGYRYFETAARDKVLYPFGYGLSYTTFSVNQHGFSIIEDGPLTGGHRAGPTLSVSFTVTNTGAEYSGKETVQLYVHKPNGLLGQPARALIAFQKTALLAPGESTELHFSVPFASFASYDDTGVTGNEDCFVLEAGTYSFYAGTDVRSASLFGGMNVERTTVVEKLHDALAPRISFNRLHPVPAAEKGVNPYTFTTQKLAGKKPSQIKHRDEGLANVHSKYSIAVSKLENGHVLSQLTDDDLFSIVRGEGMGSPRVTPGTAAGFGGVTEHMKSLGLPCACCDDGPSGMRLDTGDQAFSLPCGTMMASTWNPDLVEKLYGFLGKEMVHHQIDILLGPGMNIHRHPLNGRNFEYFSEDPLITGKFGAATIRGLHSAGVSGSLKHFCCNNQETARHSVSSTLSKRALREIYLKGYEIAVKEADTDVIMTTYGAVNGVWTAGCYDLNTVILRNEWGFKGITMTDWWANVNDETKEPSRQDLASMVRAQNDLYMVCPDSSKNLHGDNLEEEYAAGTLTRDELLRAADNIISFLKRTHAWTRLNDGAHPSGTDLIQIKGRPESASTKNTLQVDHYLLPTLKECDKPSLSIPGDGIDTSAGNVWAACLEAPETGFYKIRVTAKSDAPELAQMPVLLQLNGIPICTFTFNGTGGLPRTIENEMMLIGRNTLMSLRFALGGLEVTDVTVTFEKPLA